jgi:hypothetical protein
VATWLDSWFNRPIYSRDCGINLVAPAKAATRRRYWPRCGDRESGMSKTDKADFRAGSNIAMKTPPHQYDATVAFYRDVIGLDHLASYDSSEVFAFGSMRLWIDRVERMSQAEIWLELQSDFTANAAKRLEAAGVVRCDAIEPLPENFDGFWIANPAGVVHLVDHPKEDPTLSDPT